MGIDPSDQAIRSLRHHGKEIRNELHERHNSPARATGNQFLLARLAAGGHDQHPCLNPTWWINYVFFTDQQRQGKRALLFHRWGGLGNHRYQIGFSGDTISCVGFARISALFHRHRCQRGVRILESRHRRPHARCHRTGTLPALDSVGKFQSDSCELTPPRIPTRSGVSGPTPSRTRT